MIDPESSDRSDDTNRRKPEEDLGHIRDEEEELEPPQLLDPDAGGVVGTLGRVLSRISTNAGPNPGPAPNGGRAAWLACTL